MAVPQNTLGCERNVGARAAITDIVLVDAAKMRRDLAAYARDAMSAQRIGSKILTKGCASSAGQACKHEPLKVRARHPPSHEFSIGEVR